MAPPKIPGGSNNTKSSGSSTKNEFPPWNSPDYGYRWATTKDKNGKVTKKKIYYGQTQYLNEQLGNASLQGVIDLLKPDMSQGAGGAAAYGVNVPGSNTPMSANQTMYLFKHADPAVRAQIQDMMYRAGNLYTQKYVPSPGAPLTKQDIDAFRKFVIGVASNPAQGAIGDLLSQAADAGNAMGAANNAVFKPLVEEITNPEDIKHTALEVGKALHNTYLTPDQLKVFTAAYNTMEKAFQEQKYISQGGDLTTGMVNPDNAVTNAVITKPATVQAQAENAIRTQDSTQFKANTFTDRLDEMLAGLRGSYSASAGQVGPVV